MDAEPSTTYRLSSMRATPYPNRLLDLSLTLPETQLRVLNAIVRLTLGWHGGSPGERKATVQLSMSQLRKRVGRGSALPVVEAVAALARAGVIELSRPGAGKLEPASLLRQTGLMMVIGVASAWVLEA